MARWMEISNLVGGAVETSNNSQALVAIENSKMR
jgi:hypothetical protein